MERVVKTLRHSSCNFYSAELDSFTTLVQEMGSGCIPILLASSNNGKVASRKRTDGIPHGIHNGRQFFVLLSARSSATSVLPPLGPSHVRAQNQGECPANAIQDRICRGSRDGAKR